MKRRRFLSSVAGGTAVGVSGCLSGGPVQEIQESVRIEPRRGEWWEIEPVDGDAEIGYEVKSDTGMPFQVFYFTKQDQITAYQSYIYEDETGTQPNGHNKLSMSAVPDEDGVWQARRPQDGGRIDISIDDTHYFVVDYSNYARQLNVESHADMLQATVDVEVVEGGFL